MQLYRPRSKTAHRALQALFLLFAQFYRHKYQTDTSGYCTTCATLKHLPAPGRPPAYTKISPLRRDAVQANTDRPIIIMYIRGSGTPLLWIYARQCSISQTMQARRGLNAPHAGRLAVWHRVNGQGVAFWHTPPGGAVQRQGRGRRRGTIGGSRRISFRAFAR